MVSLLIESMKIFIYAKNEAGQEVHIDDVVRGKAPKLTCFYCAQRLMAKKGNKKVHHFAHWPSDEESCRGASAAFQQIVFDSQTYYSYTLTHKQQEWLVVLLEAYQTNGRLYNSFGDIKFCYKYILDKHEKGYHPARNYWSEQALDVYTREGFFNEGRVEVGLLNSYRTLTPTSKADAFILKLPFYLFVKLIQQECNHLGEQLTDPEELELFYKHQRRIEALNLYFIEIMLPDRMIYKIGVTERGLEQRTEEVQQFLSKQLKVASRVKPLVDYTQITTHYPIAALESYFKRKYRTNRFAIGGTTEYFEFSTRQVEAIMEEFKLVDLMVKEQY